MVAGNSVSELVDDRAMGGEGVAEIALQDLADIAEILLPERAVEAVFHHQLGIALGR